MPRSQVTDRDLIAFDPSKLSTCTNWWDVQRGVTLSGTGMVAWTDQVGGISFAQSTSARRPIYTSTSSTGKPVAAFATASQYYMIANHTSLASVSAFTVSVVFSASGTVTNQVALDTDVDSATIQILSNNLYGYVSTGNYGQVAFTDSTKGHILTQVFDGSQSGNANRLKIYLDGVQQTLSFTGTIPATTGAQTQIAIGDVTAAPVVPFNGALGDIVVCTSALGDTDRKRLERFLARKFRLYTPFS